MLLDTPLHNLAGRPSRQRGVTLIEILVTVVIVSVGLLGIAALQLTSLRNSFDSNSRSKATWFAHDIADRMRANARNARAGAYDIGLKETRTGGTVADLDLIDWKNRLAALGSGLSSGDGSIERTQVGDSTVFTITIRWKERDSANDTTFETETEI